MSNTSPRAYDIALTTALGAGFAPLAPGTAGAAVGVAVWWAATLLLPYPIVVWGAVAAVVIVTAMAVPAINRIEQVWGRDPSRVVIDEVVGVWICLWAVPAPDAWWYVAGAFVLFRALDIAKPLGIRRMESLRGGWGVMMDDVLAGLYGMAVLMACRMLN